MNALVKALLIGLVVANLGFFVWSHGWLDGILGTQALGQHEPERLKRQLRADTLVVLPAASVASTTGVNNVASTCLEAGPFSASEAATANSALKAAFPKAATGSWSDVKTEIPGAWIVYMGRYFDPAGLEKKQQELKRHDVDAEPVLNLPKLSPGLSLGRFDTRSAADKALERFAQRGLATARVVEVSPPASKYFLRAAHIPPELASQLLALKNSSLGTGFAPCSEMP